MKSKDLKKTQEVIKDLILFNSAWNKRKKIKSPYKLDFERIGVYRDLVKTSFTELITNIYPLTYSLFKNHWKELLSKYIEAYPPKSPVLVRAAEDFPVFLAKQKDITKKYPFIPELAKYEWFEVDLCEREEHHNGTKIQGLNPVHELCRFEYSIPEIAELLEKNKRLNKITKQPTNVFIYRDPKDLSIRFFELSPSSLQYIELLNLGFTHAAIVSFLATAYNVEKNNFKDFKKGADELLQTLKRSRIIL